MNTTEASPLQTAADRAASGTRQKTRAAKPTAAGTAKAVGESPKEAAAPDLKNPNIARSSSGGTLLVVSQPKQMARVEFVFRDTPTGGLTGQQIAELSSHIADHERIMQEMNLQNPRLLTTKLKAARQKLSADPTAENVEVVDQLESKIQKGTQAWRKTKFMLQDAAARLVRGKIIPLLAPVAQRRFTALDEFARTIEQSEREFANQLGIGFEPSESLRSVYQLRTNLQAQFDCLIQQGAYPVAILRSLAVTLGAADKLGNTA